MFQNKKEPRVILEFKVAFKSIDMEVGILQLESSPFVFKKLRYWVKYAAFTAFFEIRP